MDGITRDGAFGSMEVNQQPDDGRLDGLMLPVVPGDPVVNIKLRDKNGTEVELEAEHVVAMRQTVGVTDDPIVPDVVSLKGTFEPDQPVRWCHPDATDLAEYDPVESGSFAHPPSGGDGVIFQGAMAGLTAREEALRSPGGPVAELMGSGEGDTLNNASRTFLVRLDDEFEQDPLQVLRRVVDLGDPHPRSYGLYAVRHIVEARLKTTVVQCRVEYEIGRWEWHKRRSTARWFDEDEYRRQVGGVEIPERAPWSWEACMIAAVIPVAIAVRLIVPWLL